MKVEKAARGSEPGKGMTGSSNVSVGSPGMGDGLEGEDDAAEITSRATVWHRIVQTASCIGTIIRRGSPPPVVAAAAAAEFVTFAPSKVSRRRCVGGMAYHSGR